MLNSMTLVTMSPTQQILASTDGGDKRRRTAAADASASRAPQQMRVLIVEDEWFVATEIETTLRSAGYAVTGIAISAREAIQMAEIHQPEIILMDIRLKGARDGVDAALEIFRRLGLRCLFVSAYVDAETKKRAKPAKPYGWLSKPFSDRQLANALEVALRGPKH